MSPPPILTHLSQSSATWREVRSDPRHVSTTFSFVLNEVARVTLTFAQEVPGQRVRGACVTPRPGQRHMSQCMRSVTLGAVSVRGRAGHNKVAFNSHLSRFGWLPRGRRIAVTAIATAGGHHSAARRLSFPISR